MAQETIVLHHTSVGAQTVGVGKRSFVIPRGQWRLREVTARANTAPTGADFLIDVNKNGTSIFTNQADRTTITAGQNVSNQHRTYPGVFQRGDRLSYDVDVVGSSVAGSDLDTTFVLERA